METYLKYTHSAEDYPKYGNKSFHLQAVLLRTIKKKQ